MISELQDLFRLNEPEIVLESFGETRRAVLRLQDCDGYRLGRLVCGDVYALCITVQSESFSAISFFRKSDVDATMAWLSPAVPDGYQVVVLQVAEDSPLDPVLPLFGGKRLGYVICKSFEYEKELVPGR